MQNLLGLIYVGVVLDCWWNELNGQESLVHSLVTTHIQNAVFDFPVFVEVQAERK